MVQKLDEMTVKGMAMVASAWLLTGAAHSPVAAYVTSGTVKVLLTLGFDLFVRCSLFDFCDVKNVPTKNQQTIFQHRKFNKTTSAKKFQ